MSNDLTFGVRLTADGKQLVGEVRASREEFDALGKSGNGAMDAITASSGKMASQYSGLNKTVKEHTAAVTETAGSVNKLLDRYDPLGVKLRQLQADYKALDDAAASGKIAGRDDARVDAVYAKMRQEMELAGKGAIDLGLNTQYARREVMMLGKEALAGDFSRMPQTFGALVTHSNLLQAVMSPVGIAITATAVAAVGLSVAFIEGAREAKAMNDAIVYTGDYAGVARGQMIALAEGISQTSTLTIGAAKEVVTQLVNSGRIGATSLGEIAQMADTYAAATGRNIDQVGADLAKLFDDPVKGATELNSRMHFLNSTELEYIDHLVKIGEEEQARLVLAEKFNQSVPKHVENIFFLYFAWNKAGQAASSFWNNAKAIGRKNTNEENLQRDIDRIAALNASGKSIPEWLVKDYSEVVALMNKEGEAAAERGKLAQEQERQTKDVALARSLSTKARVKDIDAELLRLNELATSEKASAEEKLWAIEAISKKQKELQDIQNPKVKKQKSFDPEADFWDAVDAARSKSSKKSQEQYVKDAASAGDEANKIIDKASAASKEYVNQLQFENSLLGKNALEVQQLTEKRRIDLALEKELLALRNNDKFKARDVNPEVDAAYQRAVKGAQDAANAAKDGADIELTARDKVTRSWEFGSSEAIRKYNDQVRNSAAQAESLYSKAFKGAEDAVTRFCMTGKADIRSFGQAVIEEFYRINVSRPLVSAGAGLLQSAMGAIGGYFGGGSAAPSPAVTRPDGGMINIPGRAVGGPVEANTLYRVNEVVPEVFSSGGNDYLMTGGRGGVVTPLAQAKSSSGATQSQATTLVYSPNIQIDARGATPGMEQTIARVVNQAVEQTRTALMAELGAGGQFALATGRRR